MNSSSVVQVTPNVTVQTNPLLFIDTPGPNATLSQPFLLAGWAIDLASSHNTGVSTVHVWAYPVGGGPARFVNAVTYGGDRQDVAAAFGGSQYRFSGYGLTINSLPAGNWDLALLPFSTLNGYFFPATVRRVTVQ